MDTMLFSTAYLPPITWMAACVQSDCCVEKHETYPKQTYRNRCKITTSQGVLPLSIPVTKPNGNHTQTRNVKIDYSQPWQRTHWHAIETAYNRTPYFIYYRDDFEALFSEKTASLIESNERFLQLIFKFLRLENKSVSYTADYEKNPEHIIDLRNYFNPKKEPIIIPRYMQAFEDKLGFINDASIVDLLFNLGADTIGYLKSIDLKNLIKQAI